MIGICNGSSVQLQANGGDTYLWQPAYNLSNAVISNPIASPILLLFIKYLDKTLIAIVIQLTVQLKVNPKPQVDIAKDGDFNCNKPTVQLNGTVEKLIPEHLQQG